MEITNYFRNNSAIKVRAILIGERIDTRSLERTNILATGPLMFEVTSQSLAVVFRYGVVVLFDVSPLEETRFIKGLEQFIKNPVADQNVEELDLCLDPLAKERLEGKVLRVQSLLVAKLQLIAVILSKSVILDYYESRVATNFDLVEPIATNMKEKGHRGARTRELLKHLGEVLINQHNMVGRVEIIEKPDIIWDNPELERLYLRLEDEFEIRDRHHAIEHKLALITRTAETMLDLVQTKRALRLEWYIVVLIIIEIFLSVYALFFHVPTPH